MPGPRAALILLCSCVLAHLFEEVSSRPEGFFTTSPAPSDKQATSPPADSGDIRKFLIEDLKIKILRGLKLSEPPALIANETRHLSREVVELLQKEKEVTRTDQKENIVTNPSNSNFTCVNGNGKRCSKFDFSISSDIDSVVTAHLWVHKINWTERLWISVYSSPLESEPLIRLKEDSAMTEAESGWVTFELPKMLALHPEGDHLTCVVEIEGADVHVNGTRAPFLVATKHTEAEPLQRRRRKAPSPAFDENCGCCAETHHITLEDIGWQNWVHFPGDFDIKICRGECTENLSSFSFNYEQIISAFYRTNTDVPKPKCKFWAPRCQPDKYSSMRFMYQDKNGQNRDQEIADIVIDSCRCM